MILSKFRDIEAQRSSGRSRKMRFSSCVYGSVHVSMSHNIGTGRCNHEPIHKYMTYIFSMLIYIYIYISCFAATNQFGTGRSDNHRKDMPPPPYYYNSKYMRVYGNTECLYNRIRIDGGGKR